MSEEKEHVHAENPEKFTGLKLTSPKTVAAGIPAVISSAEHIFSEMSVTRGLKALAKLNQKDGYDCPGCAWPDPDDERSGIAEYCENGAKAIAEEATSKKLTADFFAANSVADLSQLDDYQIGKKGRVAQPMFLAKGASHYTEISWNDAFQKIAVHLNSLSSPDEAVFYTSGRTSNEAAFLYQLFVREYGTNNLPDCSNMCHESSGVALNESIGIGKGSVKLEDFYEAEVILILGQNPGTNHPRMLSALQKAKEKGAKIISINPLPETGLISFSNPQTIKGALGIKAKLTDLFLQVKLNGDMALLQAVELLLLQEEEKNPGTVFDLPFIAQHTAGYAEFKKHLSGLNLAQLIAESGISEEQVIEFASLLKHKTKIIACWAMGLTQHKNAVDTIKEVVNLLLLKGSIAKSGAGTCPVRGHSNVQGDRTMGIYEKPSEAFLKNIQNAFNFEPPKKHGYDTVECIHAMKEGKAKVFIAMGGNFLSATPDTTYTAEALQNCKLTVHVSTKLNRSHLIHGEEAIILPCLARSDKDVVNGKEQFITTENSMGVIQLSKGNLKPVSTNLLSEPTIVCRMANAVLVNKSKVDWLKFGNDYDEIRNAIEKTIPGFNQYNQRVRIPGGFYLPNTSREGTFATLNGKANFNIAHIAPIKLKSNELMMMTIRSHDQFNTTIYGLNDRYRGVFNERRVIFMNANDIAKHGLKNGDVVDLYNNYDNVTRVAHKFIVIEFSIPERCTATYFPETNVLVPINSTADKSNTPTSKMVLITLQKSKQ
ncbi:MAG: FdhF/YdeP family oxidoreductase [Bacteroidetes bacterium]|nr:FdhF/YdeP family oxidoreductase [Bacteroidota bacterium]MBK9672029.1 FdhF/YdeP family oxidoreductase [Bacteroidota bacterium]MBK9800447.1 FdhF/YdeP family oxidoreductase [Bacteroidota bacterium]MBP6414329.1 FdhF/YdeP family oxidoreductase [Bacteroidia bacterium]